jgi:hypothetical protein
MGMGINECPKGKSDDLYAPPSPPLAVDHLAAFFCPHSGAEAYGAGAFNFADFVRVVHVRFLFVLSGESF